ncbi:Flagellum-specific peptidoglycan hydrolase FlgJ [Granulicatella balaenopterae]|uniref:Peptidoglycan hydrolase n=1 Tax=Granulicatella balaenopterae TaxID=137733 RepID=A0A1H9HQH0_9LACT|nr:LysM peptidoglycan-binding domain-containing protein [Granulicatella balaenopterae]SEQ64584.1 Flagellum-specific peptidoglycan hydrolase FlgJ [Granulicatella balaenopterae]
MYVTRQQRITKQKAMDKYQSYKRINHSMKKSVAMMGTTVMMGLYVSPVAQLLTSQKAEAATVGLTNNQFINTLIPSAQKVTKGKDLYTSVMLAQAALETGMGNSTLSKAPNYNLFGIKGDYKGESVNMPTLEDSGNQNYYQINANFRKYPSYEQSLEDYTQVLLTGPAFDHNYYAGAWKSNTTSYKDATAHLTGRYATDSAYGSKLNRIIEQFDLTRYDSNEEVIDYQTVEQINHEISKTNYTVVSGDTLYGISRKTGVAVAELLQLNSITLDTIIYPGQNLKVPYKKTVDSTSAVKEDKVIEDKVAMDTAVEEHNEPVSSQPAKTSVSSQYTIVAGDTLYGISRKIGVPVAKLLSLNSITLDTIIYPGQNLTIPSKESNRAKEPAKEVATPQPAKASASSQYTIVAGDTLYGISRKTGVPVAKLVTLNGITLDTIIYPGQQLTIPAKESNQAKEVATPQLAIVTPVKEKEAEKAVSQSTTTYTIVAGDTLYGISRKIGVSLNTLLDINHLTEDVIIYPGQTLTITGKGTNQSVALTAKEATSKTYTIKAGDNLWRIAKNNGLTLEQLKSLNGLTTNIIQPNQVLKLA